MGDFMDKFREEVERAAVGPCLTSPLAEWMDTHHAQATQILSQAHADWLVVAEVFRAFGITDQTGKPPTAESARETWKRVEARRRAGMKLRPVRPPDAHPAPPGPIPSHAARRRLPQ
jgi:hypothetical protein